MKMILNYVVQLMLVGGKNVFNATCGKDQSIASWKMQLSLIMG